MIFVCAECGCESDKRARGWRAYLDDEDQIWFFCPGCSLQEFGALPGLSSE